MNMKHKKMTAMLILVSIFSPGITQAQFNTDLPAMAQRILNIVKDYGLDTLAGVLAELAGSKIGNKIVNKATGGASGDSSQNSFVSSFTDYFADFERSKVDMFITDLGISNNPYAQTIAKSMVQDAAHAASGQGLGGYSLEQVVGPNWKEFPDNVSKGGIDGLLALSDPINTNIGSGLIAQTQLQTSIATAKEFEILKLTAPGTKPQGKCEKSFKDYKADVAKTKEKIDQVKKNKDAVKNINNNTAPTVATVATSINTTSIPQGQTSSLTGQIKKDSAAASADIVKGMVESYGGCLEEFINNPVGTTTSMLTGALEQGAKKLQGADEIGEVIGGMVLSLVNSFIKGGLTALNAEFKPSGSSVGGPEQLVGKNGQSIPWTQTPTTIVDMSVEFPSALASTRLELDLLRSYNSKVTKTDSATSDDFSDKILALDACLPGPDFRFDKRLQIYKKAQISKLERMKEKGNDDNKAWRQAVYDDINASVEYATTEMQQATQRPELNIPGASVMQSSISVITRVRDTFQEHQRELIKKQSTLNILNQVESQLKGNVRELNAIDPSLRVPEYITFTDSGWERLSAAEQKTFIDWAKRMRGLPAKAPIIESEWNALSAADKKTVLDWAKDITAGSDQSSYDPTIPDKEFVLATVWLLSGVQSRDFSVDSESSCDINCTSKKTFALDALWNVWIYPENYIKNWDSESAPAVEYQKRKNAARTLYNSVVNDISIPYTINKASIELKSLEADIQQITLLTSDCNLIKSIIRNNSALQTDPNGHKKMADILKARKNEFKTPEIKSAMENSISILSDPINYYQNQPENSCTGTDMRCKQDIGIEGATDDNDDPENPGLAAIAEFYQVDIPKHVWELIAQSDNDQGDISMCRLNMFVREYVSEARKPYKPILCDPAGWMRMSKKSLVSYLFTDSI